MATSPSAAHLPAVQLLGAPGCHLCEQAHRDLDEVCGELGLVWSEIDVLTRPDLEERFATEIPVVMVDGVPRDFWHVDKPRLHRILSGLLAGRDPEA